MITTKLIFGLLDNATEFPTAQTAARARDLTIAWSRFKYSGPIIEGTSLDEILNRCAITGATHCLVQRYGTILTEVWRREDDDHPEIMQAIGSWIENQDFFITGRVLPHCTDGLDLNLSCVLIDLRTWRNLGCPLAGPPPWRALSAHGQKAGLLIEDIPPSIAASLVVLDPARPDQWTPVPAVDPKAPIQEQPAEEPPATSQQADFLDNIQRLTSQLRKGIFVWNIESYADIETPSDHFSPPLKALYTVSAGFKPNRILETHGFDHKTRMVVFDYSPQGLEFRRLIQEEWDGVDYPAFLRVLFRKIPHGEAFYLLWDGMTPQNLDWSLVQRRWQEELRAWGGEEALYLHWQKFRKMNIEYLSCDILTEHDRLLDSITAGENSLMWWSNAFFSVHSNWLYSTSERIEYYRQWIGKLADKVPGLLLYGSDCHNVSVNCYPAGQYRSWFEKALEDGGDELRPPALHRHEIRF